MKKNTFVLLLFVLLGLLAGTLMARWLSGVPGLEMLARSIEARWSPAADLIVFSFDLNVHIQLSLMSIIGAAVAIWIYRRL
ncbi:DUF4321 domain-containing protein [Paenibacillus sp. 1P07SE]|uniref:DUF4321 domain-containing protein n=1 Tax=Paenibacillus sp. 1P07SE TaxID=3132209 RepID=UPI0039A68210